MHIVPTLSVGMLQAALLCPDLNRRRSNRDRYQRGSVGTIKAVSDIERLAHSYVLPLIARKTSGSA